MVEGDPIVASGEMYVLFLTRDHRKKPDQGDLPRYLTIQAGAGKIAVPAEPSPERPFVGKMFREYSHLTSRELFFALKQRIQRSSAPIVDVVPTYPFTGRPISAGTGTNQGKTDKTKQ